VTRHGIIDSWQSLILICDRTGNREGGRERRRGQAIVSKPFARQGSNEREKRDCRGGRSTIARLTESERAGRAIEEADLDRGYSAPRFRASRSRMERSEHSRMASESARELGERRSPHKETAWDVRTRCYSCVRACRTWIDPHSRLSNDLASAPTRGFRCPRAPRPQLARGQSLLSTHVHVYVTPTRLSSPVPLNGCITIVFSLA